MELIKYELNAFKYFYSYLYQFSLCEFKNNFINKTKDFIPNHIQIILNLDTKISTNILIFVTFKWSRRSENLQLKYLHPPRLTADDFNVYLRINPSIQEDFWEIRFVVCIDEIYYNHLKRKQYNLKGVIKINKNNLKTKIEHIIDFFNFIPNKFTKFMQFFVFEMNQKDLMIFSFFNSSKIKWDMRKFKSRPTAVKNFINKNNLNKNIYYKRLKEFGVIEIKPGKWIWNKI